MPKERLDVRDDHAIFAIEEKHGKKRATVLTPSKALPIHSKEELEEQLKHYSKANGVTFLRHVIPDSQTARLRYLKRTRPALRYYCKKFKVDAPEWLVNDVAFSTMNKHQLLELFGESVKFPVREFSPIVWPNPKESQEKGKQNAPA